MKTPNPGRDVAAWIVLLVALALAPGSLAAPPQWALPEHHYRIAVMVDPGVSERINAPVGVRLDFADIFSQNAIPGRIDLNSIQVVRFDPRTGGPLSRPEFPNEYAIPHQLTGDWGNDEAGWVWWRMADRQALDYHIYFDTLDHGRMPPPTTLGLVGIGDSFHYNDGQPGYTTGGEVDWDGDGLPDRIVATVRAYEYSMPLEDRLGYTVKFYRNRGTARDQLYDDFVRLKADDGNFLLGSGQMYLSLSPMDWNEDSLMDFIGFRTTSLFVVENTGRRDANNVYIFRQPREVMQVHGESEFRETLPETVGNRSFYLNRFTFADWEGDGRQDLLFTVGHYHATAQTNPRLSVIPYGPFLAFFEVFRNIGLDESNNPRFANPVVLRDDRNRPITTATGAEPAYEDRDGDGDFDLVFSDWSGRPLEGARTMWAENVGSREAPLFIMPLPAPPPWENNERAYDSARELYPRPTAFSVDSVDWDADGLLDLVCATYSNTILFHRNLGTLMNPVFDRGETILADGQPINLVNWLDPQAEEPSHWGPQGPGEATAAAMQSRVIDWNGDGRLDLFVTGQRWQVQYFENIGTRAQPRFSKGREVRCDGDPYEFSWRSKLGAGDLDGDGRVEFVVTSDRDNVFYAYEDAPDQSDPAVLNVRIKYPLRLETGQPVRGFFYDANNNGDNHSLLVDWNADGLLDLINGSLYAVRYYENVGTPTAPLFRAHGPFRAGGRIIQTYNHASAFDAADWNGDGRLDLIMAAESPSTLHLFDRSFIENDLPAASLGGVESR